MKFQKRLGGWTLKKTVLHEKGQTQNVKNHDFIYMKCPEEANLQSWLIAPSDLGKEVEEMNSDLWCVWLFFQEE